MTSTRTIDCSEFAGSAKRGGILGGLEEPTGLIGMLRSMARSDMLRHSESHRFKWAPMRPRKQQHAPKWLYIKWFYDLPYVPEYWAYANRSSAHMRCFGNPLQELYQRFCLIFGRLLK